MDIANAIGYAAALLVGVTFWMKTMVPLRAAGIVSNFFFIAYGYLDAAYPPLVLHLVLLPLNVYRLHQMLQLNRRVSEAARGDLNMDWIKPFATMREIAAGTMLFRKDDPATTMFVILSGRYQLDETGIALAAGDIVGELGLMAPNRARTQTLRCVESGEILELGYDRVRQLYFQNPQFGFYFLQLASRRLFENIGRLENELAALRAAA